MLHYTRLQRLESNKHSRLFGQFVSYEENDACEYGFWDFIHNTSFKKNLRMSKLGSFVKLH
jgi:hypothetical protein